MVSVVITTHNRCDVLPRAIQSVLSQTYNEIELIVVSDGSTDGTDELMKSYLDKPMVNYITYSPGRGGNYARNQGIINAKGEYIAFLDDDDEWFPQKIEKQVRIFEENLEVGLVYCAVRSIFVNEDISYTFTPVYKGDLSKQILFGNVIGTTSCVMIRKDILIHDMFDEKLRAMQDHELWIRICQKTLVGASNEVLLNYYNQSAKGQITANVDIYTISKDYIHEKHKSLYDRLSKSEIKQLFISEKLGFAQRCIRNGNRSKARSSILEAMKIKITNKTIVMFILSFLSLKTILKLRSLYK